MPRKKHLRDFKIEIPIELDERLKKIITRKGHKSIIGRALLEDFCRTQEAKREEVQDGKGN